ncbi:uncharacterized protein LOC143290161 [Babylonia areolata]|uniref:uncharacterized protein LOC143290161 n=1 Tax=Babylonia areolata TaxID=304850 RepID=UPI003FD41825
MHMWQTNDKRKIIECVTAPRDGRTEMPEVGEVQRFTVPGDGCPPVPPSLYSTPMRTILRFWLPPPPPPRSNGQDIISSSKEWRHHAATCSERLKLVARLRPKGPDTRTNSFTRTLTVVELNGLNFT